MSTKKEAEMMLDSTRVEAFSRTFYGYGNWAARFWFVGMEEGGGGSHEEIDRRLRVWEERGRRELEDLVEYHQAIGVTRHIGENARLQSTWSRIARMLGAKDVRSYQGTQLGRADGESALIELLPLPSPGTADWLYPGTREDYTKQTAPWRARRIHELIARHRPKAVVFYGLAYLHWWSEIAGVELRADVPVDHDGTRFLAVKHPVATGVKNEYFARVGEVIRR